MGTGTATSPVPSLDGTDALRLRIAPIGAGGVILHAINVNNIVSNVGTYNFATTDWSNAHTLAAPTGTASSEQKFQLTFAGVTNNVSSPYLDYDTNQMFFGDSAGRIHRVDQRQLDLGVEATRPTSRCPAARAAAVPGLRQRPDHRHQRGRQALSDRHDPAAALHVRCVGAGGRRHVIGRRRTVRADHRRHQRQDPGRHQLRRDVGLRGVGAFNLMFAAGRRPRRWSLPDRPPRHRHRHAGIRRRLLVDQQREYLRGRRAELGDRAPTWFASPTTPELGATPGLRDADAIRRRRQCGHQPGHGVPDREHGGQPRLHLHRRQRRHLHLLNRISSKFAGTDGTPAAMASSFAAAGVSARASHRHPHLGDDRHHGDRQHLFREVGVASTTQSPIIQLAQQF